MASMNACNFTGRLGRDPELRSTQSGKSVCSFSLAVDGFGQNAETLWLDVSVWGRAAENCAQYLGKGREVAVTGRVGLRTYEKRDGSAGASVTLDANDVTFIGARDENAAPPAQNRQAQRSAPAADDDIPF